MADHGEINYNEPVGKWLCCYFFHKRPRANDDELAGQREGAREDVVLECKARKVARILYFRDDAATQRRRREADLKVLELERQKVPLKFRMYQWGKPAPTAFTERLMRHEARLALCRTFDDFLK
ncbi:unnamed protein product [Mesocestoides corti]|uniref:Uncharacterized protein n=1 Tax=Mesocestoides corti TaxID=53468 RepID=A0A0R3UJI6_MESCO|nr:unnamed protein product [Mesocestoides corti]